MQGLPDRVVAAIGSSAISWSDRHWRMVADAYARNPNAGFGQGVQGFLTELGLVGKDPRRHITSGYDPMYGFQMLHSSGAIYDAYAPDEVFHAATSEGRPPVTTAIAPAVAAPAATSDVSRIPATASVASPVVASSSRTPRRRGPLVAAAAATGALLLGLVRRSLR